FGAPGASIRLHWRGVRVDAVDVLVHGGDEVRTAEHQTVKNRRDARRGRGEVRAHAGPDLRAHAGDLPVLRAHHFHFLHVVSAVRGGHVVLAARLGPLHGPVQTHRAEA